MPRSPTVAVVDVEGVEAVRVATAMTPSAAVTKVMLTSGSASVITGIMDLTAEVGAA
jgi:hypothetical protein